MAPRLRLLLMLLVPTACSLLPAASAAQAGCFAPAQAIAHAGEQGCVEGTVTQTLYAERSNGQPTFLDFGPQFTAVIWGEDRAKFSPPPETLRGRQMRVSGRIEVFRGKAQIIVRNPDQLAPAGSTTTTRAASPDAAAPVAASPTPRAPSTVATTAPSPAPAAPATISAPVSATAKPDPALSTAAPATGTAGPAARALTAVPVAPAELPTSGEDGGASTVMIAAGVALIALGGAGAAWYRLRRR